MISSAIAPAFAVAGQLQSTVEPPPVRSSVWSVPRVVPCPKGCRSICASPAPAVTVSLMPSAMPPTTRLAAASASGPNVSRERRAAAVRRLLLRHGAGAVGAAGIDVVVLEYRPRAGLLLLAGEIKGERAGARRRPHGAKAGDTAVARGRVEGTLATCCQVRPFPEAVGVPGPPTFWLRTKASARRPAPGVIVAVAKLELALTFESAVRL